jgi:hypothetical protein
MRKKFQVEFFSLIPLNKIACKEIRFLCRLFSLTIYFLFPYKNLFEKGPGMNKKSLLADVRKVYGLANVHIYKLTCKPAFTLKPLVVNPLVTKYF